MEKQLGNPMMNQQSRQEIEVVADQNSEMNGRSECGHQRHETSGERMREDAAMEQNQQQSSRFMPTFGRSECRVNERNCNNFNTFASKEVNLKQNHTPSENKFDLFPESSSSKLAAAAKFDLRSIEHSDFTVPQSLQRSNYTNETTSHNKINHHHFYQKNQTGNDEQQQEHDFLPSSEEVFEEKVKSENLNESHFAKAFFYHKSAGTATTFPTTIKSKSSNKDMMMMSFTNSNNDINFLQSNNNNMYATENENSSRGGGVLFGGSNSQMMQGSSMFQSKPRGKHNLFVNDDSCNHMTGNQKMGSNAYDLFSQEKAIKQMSNSNSFMGRINNNASGCGGGGQQQQYSQQSFYPNSNHFFRSELFSSHIIKEVEQCPFNKLQQEIASQAYPLQTAAYSEEEPRYVNAAQFKRMMIMRIKRAARDLKVKKNKGGEAGGVDNSVDLTIDSVSKEQNKKYKYESRHKHATNRIRDCKEEKLAEYYEQLEREKRDKEINFDIESSTQKTDYILKSTGQGQSPNQGDFERSIQSKREMIPQSDSTTEKLSRIFFPLDNTKSECQEVQS